MSKEKNTKYSEQIDNLYSEYEKNGEAANTINRVYISLGELEDNFGIEVSHHKDKTIRKNFYYETHGKNLKDSIKNYLMEVVKGHKAEQECIQKENNIKVITYPNEEAVEWLDKLEDGWFKDKDEYIHEVHKYYRTLGSEFTTTFDNFIMRYTHWVIEETKKLNNLK